MSCVRVSEQDQNNHVLRETQGRINSTSSRSARRISTPTDETMENHSTRWGDEGENLRIRSRQRYRLLQGLCRNAPLE